MKDLRYFFSSRINQNSSKFTPSDQKIADYLLRSYPGCLLENATQISKKLALNISTVTRFFPKIGYKNIHEVQKEFKEDLNFIINSPLDRYYKKQKKYSLSHTPFHKLLALEFSNIRKTFNNINNEDFHNCIELIRNESSSIYIIGERNIFALSFYLYIQLNWLRPNVFLLRTEKSMIPDTLMGVHPDDVLIVFDFRRYPKVHNQAAQIFKELGAKIIVFTDSPLSPTAKIASLLFLVETKGVYLFDSYTAGFVLSNALIAAITKKSGEFARKRYERLEKLYKQFEIFSWQKTDLMIPLHEVEK